MVRLIGETLLNEGDKIAIGDHLFRFDMLDEIDREFQQQIHRLLIARRTDRTVDEQIILFRTPKRSCTRRNRVASILCPHDGLGSF